MPWQTFGHARVTAFACKMSKAQAEGPMINFSTKFDRWLDSNKCVQRCKYWIIDWYYRKQMVQRRLNLRVHRLIDAFREARTMVKDPPLHRRHHYKPILPCNVSKQLFATSDSSTSISADYPMSSERYRIYVSLTVMGKIVLRIWCAAQM